MSDSSSQKDTVTRGQVLDEAAERLLGTWKGENVAPAERVKEVRKLLEKLETEKGSSRQKGS